MRLNEIDHNVRLAEPRGRRRVSVVEIEQAGLYAHGRRVDERVKEALELKVGEEKVFELTIVGVETGRFDSVSTIETVFVLIVWYSV